LITLYISETIANEGLVDVAYIHFQKAFDQQGTSFFIVEELEIIQRVKHYKFLPSVHPVFLREYPIVSSI
jgi:hypothetical protein